MNTKPKRKYGTVRTGETSAQGTNDEVFDKFFRPSIDSSAIAPQTIVSPAIAPNTIVPEETQLSNESTIVQPTIAQYAIVPGQYTPIPNGILDRLIPSLHVYDQSILIRLFRLSRGHHSDTCKVGYGTLARACNMSIRQAQRSIERLIHAGWVERIGTEQGGKKKIERGSIYKINLPAATIARQSIVPETMAPDATYKESIKKIDIKTCSRCEALKGFFYPEGPEKGIAKCNHKIKD